MNEVGNDYIERALTELTSDLGVKESVDEQDLIELVRRGETKECIKAIAFHLGLPINVNISFVARGYKSNSADGFQSKHVVKTNEQGRGTGGITAQVSIPSSLPLYGTPSMSNVLIDVRLSENSTENPATFIAVMAHELSHIILYSMRHREKENEFYTDLTAMLLGFANVTKIGRKVSKTSIEREPGFLSSSTITRTQTTTYGYLSDDNFYFAFEKIEAAVNKMKSEKKKLFGRLNRFKRQLEKKGKTAFYFDKYLEFLDKNLNQNISQNDGLRISVLHQPGYTDGFRLAVTRNWTALEDLVEFAKKVKNWTSFDLENVRKQEAEIEILGLALDRECSSLRKDVKILKKYVSFFYKIKLIFSTNSQ